MATMLDTSDLNDTEEFGKWLAQNLPCFGCSCLFLEGGLGSGKTTLLRHVVLNLPGGRDAEFGSPSFTICCHYPTTPRFIHCDLYRTHGLVPEEIFENMERPDIILAIEWSELLPVKDRPEDFLEIQFKLAGDRRKLKINAFGYKSLALAKKLAEDVRNRSLFQFDSKKLYSPEKK